MYMTESALEGVSSSPDSPLHSHPSSQVTWEGLRTVRDVPPRSSHLVVQLPQQLVTHMELLRGLPAHLDNWSSCGAKAKHHGARVSAYQQVPPKHDVLQRTNNFKTKGT